ncbi:MAG: type II toxin-antitoxin system VapC family toxin [Acetobacteraceae bacterium]
MRLLLDTHIFVWFALESRRLSAPAKAAITEPGNEIVVSTATVWEISIKNALGRLAFPLDKLDDLLARTGIEPLAVSVAHAVAAGGLPRHHADPFDRMLIAQARLERLVLITEDATLAHYDVAILGRTGTGGAVVT